MTRRSRHYAPDAMHPAIVKVLPNTPEARAILAGDELKEVTFGDLVTAFVECGIVSDPTNYDSIRKTVTIFFGLQDGDFDRRIRDLELLDVDNAYPIARNVKKELGRTLATQKSAEVWPVLVEQAFNLVGTTNQVPLEAMCSEQSDRLAGLDSKIMDQGTSLMQRLPIELRIKPNAQQRLDELNRSRFAISIHQLMGMLRDNPILTQVGEVGATGIVYAFGNYMNSKGAGISEEALGGYYEGADWIDESVEERLRAVFVSEADLASLAALIGQLYYEESFPGHDLLEKQLRPFMDVLLVSRQREDEFKQAYPLAN